MANTINADNGVSSGSAGLKSSSDGTGILALQTNGTTAVTVDASQNVGIGTSSPSYKLDVRSTLAVLDGSSNIGFYANGSTYTQIWQTFQSPNDLLIKTTAAKYIAFLPNNTEQARITSTGLFQFNSGYGSVATAYGCRAWVNFNGTGTVAIRASGNVTSITDNGVGSYTVNITTAMPDANYSAHGMASLGTRYSFVAIATTSPTTSAFSFFVYGDDGSLQDCPQVHITMVR